MIDINELKYLIHDWKDILINLGLPEELLIKKGTPCPVCGGNDRFTYDNKYGNGDSHCRSCGHRDGVQLLLDYHNMQFPALVKMLADYLGVEEHKNDKLRQRLERDRRDRQYIQSRYFLSIFNILKNITDAEKRQAERHKKFIKQYENKYPHINYDKLYMDLRKKHNNYEPKLAWT